MDREALEAGKKQFAQLARSKHADINEAYTSSSDDSMLTGSYAEYVRMMEAVSKRDYDTAHYASQGLSKHCSAIENKCTRLPNDFSINQVLYDNAKEIFQKQKQQTITS